MGLFTKLFGASDNENDNAQDLDYINKLLVHSKDEPLGISENNLIYIGYSELGGYYYLQTYIVGKLKVKTKTGAKLKIEGNNYSFSMNSDMDEFESDSADRFKGYVTQIDFEIEKEIELNPNSRRKEFSMRGPDNYYITIAEFHKLDAIQS